MTGLVDTDVMIDFLRGQTQAVAFMQAVPLPVHVSARRKPHWIPCSPRVACIPLTADIATRGGLWRRDYGRSHGVGLADALIAATAEHAGLDLVTLNARHYPMLERISIPYRKN